MSRNTHLGVTDLSLIAAGDYMGLFKSLAFSPELNTVDGKAVAQRYEKTVGTKKKLTFSVEELLTTSNVRQTNLNVTVFSIGGTSQLGKLQTGSLKVTTIAKDGAGEADEWEYMYAMGTQIEISATLFADGNASLITNFLTSGTASMDVTVVISAGGFTGTFPMKLTAPKHTINVDDFQNVDVSLKGNGTPTSVSGHGLLASILTGTATGTYSASTGFITYGGAWLITSANLQFANNSIISISSEFANCGTPTGLS